MSIFSVIYLLYIFEKKALEFYFLFHLFFLLFLQSPSLRIFQQLRFRFIILNEILKGNQNAQTTFCVFGFCFQYKTLRWCGCLYFAFLYFLKKSTLQTIGLGLVVLGIYIFKNIWVLGMPFFQFSCSI